MSNVMLLAYRPTIIILLFIRFLITFNTNLYQNREMYNGEEHDYNDDANNNNNNNKINLYSAITMQIYCTALLEKSSMLDNARPFTK